MIEYKAYCEGVTAVHDVDDNVVGNGVLLMVREYFRCGLCIVKCWFN